jgi:hypothetical protein
MHTMFGFLNTAKSHSCGPCFRNLLSSNRPTGSNRSCLSSSQGAEARTRLQNSPIYFKSLSVFWEIVLDQYWTWSMTMVQNSDAKSDFWLARFLGFGTGGFKKDRVPLCCLPAYSCGILATEVVLAAATPEVRSGARMSLRLHSSAGTRRRLPWYIVTFSGKVYICGSSTALLILKGPLLESSLRR